MKKTALVLSVAACLCAAISAQAADLKFDPDKFETRSIKAGEKEGACFECGLPLHGD